jgi:hypothetical protein
MAQRVASHGLGPQNTGVSPYFMVYGTEAVLPADIAFRSARVENFDEGKVNEV